MHKRMRTSCDSGVQPLSTSRVGHIRWDAALLVGLISQTSIRRTRDSSPVALARMRTRVTRAESESSYPKLSTSSKMRLARSPLVQITCILMMIISSTRATRKLKSTSMDSDQEDNSFNNKTITKIRNQRKQFKDEINANNVFEENESKNEQQPILPPIILLDFVNKVNNSSSDIIDPNDEKSKRTINENLGYGFNQNNIFNGKHNFYFPIGKTGTAVTIEESISPFEPKTVTEIIKPIIEQTNTNVTQNGHTNHQLLFEALPDPLPLQINREPLPIYPPYPSFGQRTKLQKTSSSDFGQQVRKSLVQHFSKSHLIPPSSDNYNNLFVNYASMKPAGYQTISSDFSSSVNSHARPMTSHYLNYYMPDMYSSSSITSSSNQKSSTDQRTIQTNKSDNKQEYNLANYPRYTIENGIKYEHKIIWKYPDGKISETPPTSYVNSYSEYVEQQKINNKNKDNMHLSNLYQFHPITPKQQELQETGYTSFTDSTHTNVYSQKPVQFPINQEPSIRDHRKEQNKIISSSNIGVSSKNRYESINSYNPDNYQGQYGLRENPKYNAHKLMTNHKEQENIYNNHRPVPKYIVNSPNPEYNYQIENIEENLFSSNGQINKKVLAKYSPEAQSYLMKIFSSEKSTIKNEDEADKAGTYANTDYSHLLNYNPSITQYIKNPSSILNAQPTFIQIGNSLIPVIILRVDGASPIQYKSGANINLKALLRQYLTQYATSVSKVNQNTNYNLGSSLNDEQVSTSPPNPVEDLKHLTESLASLRQHGYQDPDFIESRIRNIVQKSQPIYQENSQVAHDYTMNYSRFVKDYQKIHAGQQTRKPQQKVKNVQIIEEPRYTSYKYEN